jgi:hypothetical protein
MNRSLPWGWILLAGLLLLIPGPAGRLLLDILGGLTLTLLLLPLLLGAAGLIGWRLLSRRLVTCSACGAPSIGMSQCPSCGAPISASGASNVDGDVDASSATITVDAVAVDRPPAADPDGTS